MGNRFLSTAVLLFTLPLAAQTHDHTAMLHEQPAAIENSMIAIPNLLQDVAMRKPIALDQWQTMAAQSNPSLVAARAKVRVAQAGSQQAGLLPNPEIGYQGDQIRGGSYHGGEQGAYLQQTFVLGGKLARARQQGEAEAHAAEVAVEQQQASLRGAVGAAFYTALRAQAEIQVRRDLLSIAHDTAMTARGYANVGQADAPDVLAAEVEENAAAVKVVEAQREYLASFRVLASLAGAPAMEVRPLEGLLEDSGIVHAHELAERMVNETPEVKRAEKDLAVAEAHLRVEERRIVPDLTVKAGEQWNGEQLDNGRTTGAQSFVSAGMQLPLWNRNQYGTEAARVDVEAARAHLASIRLKTQAQAAALEQQYESARFAADNYRTRMLPRAATALQMYTQQYNRMSASYQQVLLWQRRLGELRVESLHRMEDAQHAKIALENFGLGME